MQMYKAKEDNPKRKFRRLKVDLRAFAKVLNNLEKGLERNSFPSQDIKPLKDASVLLFFHIVTQNLTENSIFLRKEKSLNTLISSRGDKI